MSDRLKKLKKLSIAISYAALLSAPNAFAADSETLKAQEEQFDIFDVDTEQLDQLDGSKEKTGKVDPASSLSEKDFDESFNFEDDLFVDAVDESGDIEKEVQTENAAKVEKAEVTENTRKKETVEQKPAEEQITPDTAENQEAIELEDEDYVFNNEEADSLSIPEEEEFKKLLMGDEGNIGDDAEEAAIEDPDMDNSAVDDLFSDFDNNNDTNLQSDGSDSIENIGSDEDMQFDADMEVPEEIAPASSKASFNDGISGEIKSEYKKLKKHLDNFLLSFAGENESSMSKASSLYNMEDEVDEDNDFYGIDESSQTVEDNDIVEFNPEQMFEEDKTADIDNEIADANIPDENFMNEGNTSVDEGLDNFDDFFGTDENNVVEPDPDEEKKLSEAKRLEEERIKKEKEEKELQEKQKIIVGSCSGLAEKIANCESFECEMPNPANGGATVKVSIIKSGDNCSYKTSMSDSKSVDCTLGSSDISMLSTLTQNYFDEAGKENFDVKKEFPNQCSSPSTKVASNTKPEEKRPVSPQPKKLELSTEDKAYFEMLDKKRKALPKDKQLPDSVIETIREVAPSIAEEKKEVPSWSKNIDISRGSGNIDPYEDEDAIRSGSGMEISLSKGSNIESEKMIKMEKAYRALIAGQTSAAVVLYNQVLELDGNNMDALFGLATAYHKNYQYEQARATYAKILRIEPNNKEVLSNFLVLVADESPESALLELQKLERINSNFSPIPAQIAMIYLKLGQPETAERYLRRAVVLSPDNITYKYNLAITSDKLNKHYQAISLYKQVLEAAKGGAMIPGSVTAISNRMDYLQGKLSSMN